MNYAEWGERLVKNGPKNYYFSEGWYYSIPVYPPVSILTFGGLYQLNEKRYILAQVHNLIRFPPSSFIIYFYKWGYILLLKLPGILADLALSAVVYKLIFKLSKNKKMAVSGMIFYLFNPISIFLSGAWGQTDSVVAFLGIVSFLLLLKKNAAASIPLLFLSLYFKPSWAIFAPFYLFSMFLLRPKFWSVFFGIFGAFLLFWITTQPFSDGSAISYGIKLFRERYQVPVGIEGKASVSAFNFQTIFLRLDIDFAREKIFGIAGGILGFLIFFILNIFAFINFKKIKNKTFGMMSALFTIGMGNFLFSPTMLERYFFPAFAPMIILAFTRPKIIVSAALVNVILFANIIYSFYRRGSDEIYHFFIDNNFFVIRALSFIQIGLYFWTTGMLQLTSGKRIFRGSLKPN